MPSKFDSNFVIDRSLETAIDYIRNVPSQIDDLPLEFPELGIGQSETLALLAPYILGKSARLGGPESFAHMDPPTF